MAYNSSRDYLMLRKIFKWLGIEANARAITTLLTIGGALGAAMYFAIEKAGPLLSSSLSSTNFGEGYRSGKRETELQNRLDAAEQALEAIRQRERIEREIEAMTPEERRELLKKWIRD